MSARKLYRPSWAAWVSLVIHLVWMIIFVYIMWVGPSGRDIATEFGNIRVPYCEACDSASDAIRAAHQIGRLDFVSLALTVLGVSLAVMALFGFFAVRAAAMNAAREEAGERASLMLPALVTREIIADTLKENPQLLLSALNTATDIPSDVDANDANMIAEAASGDGDG